MIISMLTQTGDDHDNDNDDDCNDTNTGDSARYENDSDDGDSKCSQPRPSRFSVFAMYVGVLQAMESSKIVLLQCEFIF